MNRPKIYSTDNLILTVWETGNPQLHVRIKNSDWDEWKFLSLTPLEGEKMKERIEAINKDKKKIVMLKFPKQKELLCLK